MSNVFSSEAFLTTKQNNKTEITTIYIQGKGGNDQYIYEIFKTLGITKKIYINITLLLEAQYQTCSVKKIYKDL